MEVGVTVKAETPDTSADLTPLVLDLCKKNSKGVSDAMIQDNLPSSSQHQRVHAINKLLKGGHIELLTSGNTLLYRFKDSQAATKTRGFDVEEKLIYQIIEVADNKGIWIRDIRNKCSLPMVQVNKVLKSLEGKKLIKAVNSVSAGKKKVYMLYNLEPDSTVTGGAWYSDQDFESEFVDILNQQCFKFLEQKSAEAQQMKIDPLLRRNRSYATSQEVWKYISELGISKVTLSEQDIETILDTIIYDGKAEMIIVSDTSGASSSAAGDANVIGQKKLYRSIKPLVSVPGLMRMPCGVCPVVRNCYPGGSVSPQTCIYLKEWLE